METILVVDDEESVRMLLRRVIEDMGHRVLAAADAASALETLERERVRVVFCDMQMPGPDGAWLIDQILKRFPDTPVAVATGLVEMDPNITLREGVVGYIVKPFRYAAVAEVIRAAMEPRRKAQPHPRDLDLDAFDAV